MKQVDINKSIYEITQDYPDVVEIMVTLGFKDITKNGMLQTAGRVMTLKKGAALKKIEWEEIERAFKEKGYKLV